MRKRTHRFKQFLFNAIKDHIVADGRIGAQQAGWLRHMIIAHDRFDEDKYKFLHQLRGEIKEPGLEFAAILEGSRDEHRQKD